MAPKTRAFVKRAKEDTSSNCNLEPHLKELCDKVFLNDLLREKIIDYAIHSADGSAVSSEDALACRLAQKQWLDSVSKCLVKSGEALLQFTVQMQSENSRSLEFLGVLDESERVLKRAPPFKLSVRFRPENFEPCRKLFEKYLRSSNSTNGLVELCVSFFTGETSSKRGRSSVFLDTSQPLSLPVLRKLSLLVPNYECKDGVLQLNGRNRDGAMEIKPRNMAPATACILSGCKQLIDFHLEGLSRARTIRWRMSGPAVNCVLEEILPPNFEDIALPPTITKLKIDQEMNAGCMEKFVLNNNRISNLTQLTLSIPSWFHVPHNGNDLIYRILERHCNSLRTLEIGGESKKDRKDLTMTQLRLPVMTRLRSFIIRARNCEWPNGTVMLEEKLPRMKKMELGFVTPLMLMQSTEGSRFEFVEEAIFKIGPTYSYQCPDFLTLDFARAVHQALPHVTKLTISTILMTTVGEALQYLFRNMTLLQVLTLEFRESNRSPSLRFLYSFLSGRPLPEGTPEGPLPSITDLTELEEFNLTLADFCMDPCLKTDSFFQDSLVRMPKLRKVTLPWQFQVSSAIMTRWKEQGRQILMQVYDRS